jgi:hypothetical protein
MCDPEELPLWRDIEKRIRQSVPWAQSGELTLPAPPAPGERRADSNGNRPGQNQRNTPPASRARDQRLRQPHQASPASQGERQPRSPERQPRGPQGSAPAANPGHQVPRRAPRDQAPSPYGGLPRAAVSQPEAPRTSEFGARVERDWY